ncbi:ectonucleotide pyrophosphatase/phosphodiesterase family member 5 [Rhinophrynus dorsalis]
MPTDFHWRLISLCALIYSGTYCLKQEQRKVLVVSFDGFRWDYVTKFPTPNFKSLIEKSAHVKHVTNIFITKTYPIHYTLVTGLYAENHGVVANEMFDPVLNETFSMNHLDIYKPEFWEDAVPIWVTNQLQGHGSGAAMWPGTDVKIHNVFPTRYLPYNESVPFEFRVHKLIDWFNEGLINLGLLYWEEPDFSGHILGPDNPSMEQVVADVDAKLGYLVDQLKRAKLWGTLNVIITSDHGMSQCSLEKVIALDDYVDRELYTMVDHSPDVAILPKQGKLDEVYRRLHNAHPNMTVYKREEIPVRFHYKENVRIQPILLLADVGWQIIQNRSDNTLWGDHGYDNLHPDMHPLLIASGPAFRKHFTQDIMNSTDLYPLLCHLLHIKPLPNNGSLSNVLDLLASSPMPKPIETQKQNIYASFIGIGLGIALIIVFFTVFLKHLYQSQVTMVRERSVELTEPLLHR